MTAAIATRPSVLPEVVPAAPMAIGSGRYAATYEAVTIEGTVYLVWRAAGDEPGEQRVSRVCDRCGGTGVLREYGHVYDGECFGCAWTGRGKSVKGGIVGAQRNERAKALKAVRDAKAREAAEAEYAAGAAAREEARVAALVAVGDRLYEEAAAMNAAHVPARFYGQPGEKITVTGVVKVNMSVDGYAYGSTQRFVIIEGTGEQAGVTVKCSGTAQVLYDIEQGETVTIACKVKKHETYRGVPQTVVTHPKAV